MLLQKSYALLVVYKKILYKTFLWQRIMQRKVLGTKHNKIY